MCARRYARLSSLSSRERPACCLFPSEIFPAKIFPAETFPTKIFPSEMQD